MLANPEFCIISVGSTRMCKKKRAMQIRDETFHTSKKQIYVAYAKRMLNNKIRKIKKKKRVKFFKIKIALT